MKRRSAQTWFSLVPQENRRKYRGKRFLSVARRLISRYTYTALCVSLRERAFHVNHALSLACQRLQRSRGSGIHLHRLLVTRLIVNATSYLRIAIKEASAER